MKKLATILGAIVIGFTIVSCTGSPKEAILKDVNEFFGQAEAKIKAIDNAGDLMNFINTFSKERDNFGEQLDTKYKINDKGIYKGMNAEGMDALMEEISNRATEYNKVSTPSVVRSWSLTSPVWKRLPRACMNSSKLVASRMTTW